MTLKVGEVQRGTTGGNKGASKLEHIPEHGRLDATTHNALSITWDCKDLRAQCAVEQFKIVLSQRGGVTPKLA